MTSTSKNDLAVLAACVNQALYALHLLDVDLRSAMEEPLTSMSITIRLLTYPWNVSF